MVQWTIHCHWLSDAQRRCISYCIDRFENFYKPIRILTIKNDMDMYIECRQFGPIKMFSHRQYSHVADVSRLYVKQKIALGPEVDVRPGDLNSISNPSKICLELKSRKIWVVYICVFFNSLLSGITKFAPNMNHGILSAGIKKCGWLTLIFMIILAILTQSYRKFGLSAR